MELEQTIVPGQESATDNSENKEYYEEQIEIMDQIMEEDFDILERLADR